MEDKLLREKFSSLKDYESTPSPKVWNNLESQLKNRKSKSFQSIFNYSVAASLVVLFGLVFSQIFKKPEVSAPTAQELHIKKDSTAKSDTLSIRP